MPFTGSTTARTEQCTEFTKLVASKAVSKALALLKLTWIKVENWMSSLPA